MTTTGPVTRYSSLAPLRPLAKWTLFVIGLALLGYVLWSVCFVLIRLLGLHIPHL